MLGTNQKGTVSPMEEPKIARMQERSPDEHLDHKGTKGKGRVRGPVDTAAGASKQPTGRTR